MAKKVKTKKEKILADLRRASAPTSEKRVDSTVYSIPVIQHTPISVSIDKAKNTNPTAIVTSTYSYLSNDLFKTILLTGSIVIAELAIKFLLKI